MDKIDFKFSEEFKSLWEQGSKVRVLLDALEVIIEGLIDKCQKQASKQATIRPLKEMEKDIYAGNKPKDEIIAEFINYQWNRIILRTQYKVLDSLQVLFFSSNTWNMYGCALATRSIIEHIAILEHLASIAPWRKSRLVHHDDLKDFFKMLYRLSLGSRFNWDKAFSHAKGLRELLESGNWDRTEDERIPKITDLIKSLDNTLCKDGMIQYPGEVRFVYTILCDVIHPSWGGDFIYSTDSMYKELKTTDKLSNRHKLFSTLFCLPVIGLLKHFYERSEQLPGDAIAIIQRVEGNFPEPVNPKRQNTIARNAPCPCGSGKKYKRCCGK